MVQLGSNKLNRTHFNQNYIANKQLMRAEEFMKDLKNSNLDFTKDYK